MRFRICVTIAALVMFASAGSLVAGGSTGAKLCCVEHHACCDEGGCSSCDDSGCACCGSEQASITSTKQWSIVNISDPMLVNRSFVSGPVLIVHDDQKMARGEPCTTFYRFEPGVGPKEALVSFHCKPRRGSPIATTKLTTARLAGVPQLLEYQLAGDAEAHGVPR